MSAVSPPDPRSTVLVIDDTPTNLDVMVDFLETQGLRVLIARDGEEALHRAELLRPDLILLDVVMPGMDGFEVCRRLKGMAALRETPVIFMTALTESREKIRGFEVGGVDFVTKPIEIFELRARVTTHLRLHAMQMQLAAQNAQLHEEIARRTEATEALEEQRAFLQQVIDMNPQCLFVTDRDDRFTLVNRALAELTHTTVEDLIGKRSVDVPGDPAMAARVRHNNLETLETQRDKVVPEATYTDPSGEVHILHTILRPLMGKDGRASQLLGVATDITARKRIERELERYRDGLEKQVVERTAELNERNRQLHAEIRERERAENEVRSLNAGLEARVAERTQQLRAAVEDLEAFSYSVSHDLRAPLRAIDNFANILLEDHSAALDAEGQRLFRIVRKNVTTMAQLINDILAFARAGRREFALKDVDLHNLAHDVWSDISSTAAGRTVQVTIGPIPRVQADQTAIRQVLFNLVDNAVKFTGPRAVAALEIGGKLSNDMVVCYVKDNGVGFDPQYTHNLFGVFRRLHHADQFEGTGIGLGIVKRIIDKHGGRVWAEGSLDDGATFFFSLPRDGSRVKV